MNWIAREERAAHRQGIRRVMVAVVAIGLVAMVVGVNVNREGAEASSAPAEEPYRLNRADCESSYSLEVTKGYLGESLKLLYRGIPISITVPDPEFAFDLRRLAGGYGKTVPASRIPGFCAAFPNG